MNMATQIQSNIIIIVYFFNPKLQLWQELHMESNFHEFCYWQVVALHINIFQAPEANTK